MANENEQNQPIIVKKVVKGDHGHHGGAWKVAYADFVTAMMAFFLLLWLLNVTTAEEKTAISNYFDPTAPKISSSESGAGGVMGGLSISPDGAMVTNVQPITKPKEQESTAKGGEKGDGDEKDKEPKGTDSEDPKSKKYNLADIEKEQLEEQLEKLEDERFEEAQKEIQEAMAASPDLQELAKHLLMDITPEGLRIQIVDTDGRSMFPSGSADMHSFMREILDKVGGIIKDLPNQISVRGHTDGVQYRPGAKYNNWDLSSDRAHSSRRALVGSGLPEGRIETVVGRADRDHLIPENPTSEQNRRISLILLRDRLTRDTEVTSDELRDKLEGRGVDDTRISVEKEDLEDSGTLINPANTEDDEGTAEDDAEQGEENLNGDITEEDDESLPEKIENPIEEYIPAPNNTQRVLEFD